MNISASEMLIPRILVVDDEHQIHASLRLRLAKEYALTCCSNPTAALALLDNERFDLCIVDIHMPEMNGLSFIEAAQRRDPLLGFVVLSAFDTDENLRRTIPLQVYDFVPKPIPGRQAFEARVPQWVETTRRRRRENALACQANAIAGELDSAKLERDVELVASETARDALLQTANLLTTIQALVNSANSVLLSRARSDQSLAHLLRTIEEARKTTEAAVTVAEGFFDSAYGNRDSSAALVNEGARHAIDIATRMTAANSQNKTVDFSTCDARPAISGLSGIEFLLMVVPAIAAAIVRAPSNSTIRVRAELVSRLDLAFREPGFRDGLWINRKRALVSRPGVLLTVNSRAMPLNRADLEAWLSAQFPPLAAVPARGLARGLQKCQGVLGMSQTPPFKMGLALAT